MEAIIYKSARNVMQAGLNNTKKWVLQVKNINSVRLNSLVNVTSQSGGNNCTLFFDTKELAINFAKKNLIQYRIQNDNKTVFINKTYQDNITKNRNMYYFDN